MNPKGIPSNYVQNERGEWCHPSRVGRLLPTQPKQDAIPALDQSKKARRRIASRVALHIRIIRFSPGELDSDDNLPFAYKGLKDAIAKSLGIDDNDKTLRWKYDQVIGRPKGTVVIFST